MKSPSKYPAKLYIRGPLHDKWNVDNPCITVRVADMDLCTGNEVAEYVLNRVTRVEVATVVTHEEVEFQDVPEKE